MQRVSERDLYNFFLRERAEGQRERYAGFCPLARDPRRALARAIEGEAAARLGALGFDVRPTAHTAHFDLLAIGEGWALRCEVKAARWDGERYQMNLRDNDADVVLFGCVDGALRWFVIPFEVVRGRRVVKVTAHNPADYIGRLTPYFEAWECLPDLARSVRNLYQLSLWGAL